MQGMDNNEPIDSYHKVRDIFGIITMRNMKIFGTFLRVSR